MKTSVKKKVQDADGQVLVLFAILLVVIMGFAALVVDAGAAYNTKAKLQKAADAAALAGAQELPSKYVAEEKAKDYAKLNDVEKSNTTPTTPHEGDEYKIKVVCTEKIEYSFAGVLSDKFKGKKSISASAVAKKSTSWQGEALPFINLDFDYSTTDPIAWTKVGPGIRGTLTDFYTRGSGSNTYFELDYTDGLTVTPGYANGAKGLDESKLKDGLAKLLTKSDMGIKKVYLFSLRSDIIKSGKFTVNGGKQSSIDDLKNDDVIDPHQLVLIECRFDDCDWSNQHNIKLTYLGNVFDLGNNDPKNPLPDFPTEHLSSTSGSSSLVE